MRKEIMKKPFDIVFFIVILSLVYGCATLSRNQCLQADWYEIGRRDGSLGKTRSVFQKHFDACLKYGVQADRNAYYQGRANGLHLYCTFDSGLEQGKLSRVYKQVCPPNLEPDFIEGYEIGKRIHECELKIASLEHRQQRIEKKIKKKEIQLSADGISNKQRRYIRSEVKMLDMEYWDIAREIKLWQSQMPLIEQMTNPY